jgi:hypothetical protein
MRFLGHILRGHGHDRLFGRNPGLSENSRQFFSGSVSWNLVLDPVFSKEILNDVVGLGGQKAGVIDANVA